MKAIVKYFNFIGNFTVSTFVLDLQSLSDQPDLYKEDKKLSRTYTDRDSLLKNLVLSCWVNGKKRFFISRKKRGWFLRPHLKARLRKMKWNTITRHGKACLQVEKGFFMISCQRAIKGSENMFVTNIWTGVFIQIRHSMFIMLLWWGSGAAQTAAIALTQRLTTVLLV